MKIDRLISIIMILLNKDRVGAQELADMFEVTNRTIYRDIDAINVAGIPVRGVSGAGGGFELMPEYKLGRRIFSTADLSAILTGLSGLSDVIRDEELTNALAKVRSFVPEDMAREVELKSNQILIDFNPWFGNRNIQPCLETVKTALQESRPLSFEYVNRSGNNEKRTVEPYRLVLKNSRWYLQGYCRSRKDFRLFKLSRMSGLRLCAEVFLPKDCRKPQQDIDDMAAQQTEIRLRIHRSVMERVLDYCGFERFSPDGGECYIVRFPFVENDYCYDMLLGFGEKCEVLEPPRVRAEMKRRADGIARLYD